MDIDVLRRATAADHSEVENAIPLMSDQLTLATYVAVLQRMLGMVTAWEKLGEETTAEREYPTAPGKAPRWMQPMMKQRQRQGLLEDDIRSLNSEALSTATPALPAFTSDAEFLGGMYVMEGSRLGGQHIAKHVESVLGFDTGRGNAYFRGYGQQTSAMWREFLEVLRTRVPDSEADTVIQAARLMFRAFGEWMRGVAATGEPNEGLAMAREGGRGW